MGVAMTVVFIGGALLASFAIPPHRLFRRMQTLPTANVGAGKRGRP
jgi:hypothetical protein